MPRRRQKKRNKIKGNNKSKLCYELMYKEIKIFESIDIKLWESMVMIGFIRQINYNFYQNIIIPKDIEKTIQLYSNFKLNKNDMYDSVQYIIVKMLTLHQIDERSKKKHSGLMIQLQNLILIIYN